MDRRCGKKRVCRARAVPGGLRRVGNSVPDGVVVLFFFMTTRLFVESVSKPAHTECKQAMPSPLLQTHLHYIAI